MERLDKYVHTQLNVESREKAKAAILAGHVLVNQKIIKKPAFLVAEEDEVKILKLASEFVGRGGDKLLAALTEFKIDLNNKTAIDIGASTGGFTDCMIKNGIKKVYAVDVGREQLHHSLLHHKQVVVMEETDIRSLSKDDIKDELTFFTIDVSFISIKRIIPSLKQLLGDYTEGIILLKPQFEVGKDNVGKNGIVRSKICHEILLNEMTAHLELSDMTVCGIINSPFTGKRGNVEYLIYINNSRKESHKYDYENIVNQGFLSKGKRRH
jgi:23S rRNA (cytidine1920-2'-O)/16S rRNA (cytidine1409-2'-O)-methyltransferase